MVPVPYTDGGSKGKAGVFSQGCPNCDGTLVRTHQMLTCEQCGHVPKHGAD